MINIQLSGCKDSSHVWSIDVVPQDLVSPDII